MSLLDILSGALYRREQTQRLRLTIRAMSCDAPAILDWSGGTIDGLESARDHLLAGEHLSDGRWVGDKHNTFGDAKRTLAYMFRQVFTGNRHERRRAKARSGR